jgi:AraC-like DNA-binding protein
MGDIWGRAGTTVAERCAGVPDGAEGPARLGLLVDALLRRLDDAPDLDPVATRAASMLADHPAPPVRDLARQADLSERQLRRRVEVAVGYPPRTLARILRFQRFLDAARSSPSPRRDLARLAAETGYADQAHLTRDSRQLAGLRRPRYWTGRPGAWLPPHDRAPLLFVRFGEDHVIPAKAARHNSEKYEKSKATTAYREYPGRPHFSGAPGWEEVAAYALDWAGKNARTT